MTREMDQPQNRARPAATRSGADPIRVDVCANPDVAAEKAAAFIATQVTPAVSARGRFLLAVSGGRTPWRMLRALAHEPLPWDRIHVFQVDERVAPAGDPDRNANHLRACFVGTPLDSDHIHAMPVEDSVLDGAARRYANTLQELAGSPAILDLVHLGLGPDGHTASLVPNDPVLAVTDRDVALTSTYQGRRRMTLTYPILNRARAILWLATGSDKAEVLPRLRDGDQSIPGGRIRRSGALIIADQAAAARLAASETSEVRS
jgi:6-phosphogluconolactonase